MIIWDDLDVMVHFTESCICYEPTIIDINGMGKTTNSCGCKTIRFIMLYDD